MGAPTKGAKAKAMLELLEGTTWKSIEGRNLGAAVHEQATMAQALGAGHNVTCALDDISSASYRILAHYQSRHQFAADGQFLPPRDDYMACSSRMMHGFAVVWNETNRIRREEAAEQKRNAQ